MERRKAKGRKKRPSLFYVVTFIETPFEGIDEYVCVPRLWVIPQSPSGHQRAVVTYPNNDDPLDTRDRVRRRERPNGMWKFYMAIIKYESDNYEDAEDWIAMSNHGRGEEESEIRDTLPEPVVNKRLRSASQPSSSGSNSDKTRLTVARQPLPRILIRRPLSQKPHNEIENKGLKLNGNAKTGSSKKDKSIIITDTQFIQNYQTETTPASNDKTNTEQGNQLVVIKETQSIEMSGQSTLAKLLAEQQPPPNLSAQQQLSLQPQPGRQSPPKLTVEQQFVPKLPGEQQPSLVGQDYQPPHSMSTIDPNESGKHYESCKNIMHELVMEKRPPPKTRRNILEQTPHPDSVNKGSTPLVRHEHSIPEPHSRDVSARQSTEPIASQKTHLHQISPRIEEVPKRPSTAMPHFRQCRYPELSILPISSTLNSKIQSQKIVERNSIEVAHNHQRPRFQGFNDSRPYNVQYKPNWGLSQVIKPISKKKSSAVKNLKIPVDKKTGLEGISNNITIMQNSPSSIREISSLTGSAVMKTAPLVQNLLPQTKIDGSLENNIRYSIRDKFIDQEVPLSQYIMNTSAAQSLSELAKPYHAFVGASGEQQYLPTQENYLQQSAHIQFQPRYENQYIPVNSAYAQEVIKHELMMRPTDAYHTTYKPKIQSGVNIQLAAQNLSNHSYPNSEHLQQKQVPSNYQEPCTASAQNYLFLKPKSSFHNPEPLRATKRPRSLSMSQTPRPALSDAQRSCLMEELGIKKRVNQSSTGYNNIHLADIHENHTAEPLPTTQNFEVQTMPLSERPHGTLFTLVQSNLNHQHPHIEKTMVDQATETESMMDIDYSIDGITGSPLGENASKVVDSACQTDEWLREEQGSPYQETVSDFETATEQESESENEVSKVNKMNPTQENQQTPSKILAEQDILDVIGTLFTQMGANLALTRDMFNDLRNSILVCVQTYKILLEKVDKFNSIETLHIPTSLPNSVISQVLQEPQERPGGDNDNNTDVGDATTPISDQKGKFFLPAEYDPNDTNCKCRSNLCPKPVFTSAEKR